MTARSSSEEAAAALSHADPVTVEQHLLELLKRRPQDSQVHRAMAVHASRTGRAALALRHMEWAVDLNPTDPGLQFQLGSLRAHSGQYQQALPCFVEATKACPDHGEAFYLLALALIRLGRGEEALSPLRRACALLPREEKVLEALAELEFRIGFPADALPLWERLAALRPGDLHTTLKLGESLSRVGRFADAARGYERALSDSPQSPELWMALGQACEDRGNRDRARDAYSQALRHRPGWPTPLAALLGIDRGDACGLLVAQAREMLLGDSLADSDRALLGYALGRTYDATGDFQAAWECWQGANFARQREAGEPDPGPFASKTERTIADFGTDAWPHDVASGENDERFVFIVGMPRSGTTLVEQIVGAHPDAHPCGELPDIALIVRELAKRAGVAWPEFCTGLQPETLAWARQRYRTAAIRHGTSTALRLLDKEPLNFRYLGLVRMMFPRARVVWCRRDPRDVAVSIFSENFSLAERLATDLSSLGHYINQQDRLMRHWQSVLPLPVLTLQYEKLVAATEAETRRLTSFLGLQWSDACLHFNLTARAVQTPSRWQVREPVHTRSVGRWRNYSSHLGPLLGVLQTQTYPEF